jgi:hypothetical protein
MKNKDLEYALRRTKDLMLIELANARSAIDGATEAINKDDVEQYVECFVQARVTLELMRGGYNQVHQNLLIDRDMLEKM